MVVSASTTPIGDDHVFTPHPESHDTGITAEMTAAGVMALELAQDSEWHEEAVVRYIFRAMRAAEE